MTHAKKIGPDELIDTDSTPEIERLEAFARNGLWIGTARTQPGLTSGWHHHGDHDTIVYALEGALRIELDEMGDDAVEANSGDFLVIPSGVVHRESTPSDGHSKTIVIRAGGDGPPTIEVDGADAGSRS